MNELEAPLFKEGRRSHFNRYLISNSALRSLLIRLALGWALALQICREGSRRTKLDLFPLFTILLDFEIVNASLFAYFDTGVFHIWIHSFHYRVKLREGQVFTYSPQWDV